MTRRYRQHGLTLIETMVALALLGVIVIAILSGLSAVSLSATRHQEVTQVDRLVRSEAEYLKSQTYSPKPATYVKLSQAGYVVTQTVTYYDHVRGTFSAANRDNGLQEIVVTVQGPHGSSETLHILKGQP